MLREELLKLVNRAGKVSRGQYSQVPTYLRHSPSVIYQQVRWLPQPGLV
jgi:hypothetical protein